MGCCNGKAPDEASESSSSSSSSSEAAGTSKAIADSPDKAEISNPAAGSGLASFTNNDLPSAPVDALCYVWGDNQYGQMADGTQSASTGAERPRNIVMFKKKRQPVDVSAGNGHLCLVTKEGQLFAWGNNDKGQCGNGSTSTSGLSRPVRSSFFFKAPAKMVVAVACGGDFSLALTSDGKVFGFGGNAKGQLGIGAKYQKQQVITEPTALPLSCITQIAAGKSHGAAVNSDQALFLFGSNEDKQLGLNGPGVNQMADPTKCSHNGGDDKVVSVDCGDKCTAFVISAPDNHGQTCLFAGDLYGCGIHDSFGGHGKLKGKQITQVSLGGQHALILTKSGKVFVWGAGWATGCEAAGAPAGTKTFCKEPEEMEMVSAGIGLSYGRAIQVAAGKNHSLALMEQDGLCLAWGSHNRSQLGIGMSMNTGIKKPCLVRADKKGKLPHFYKVFAAGDTTVALADNSKTIAPAAKAALNLDTFTDVTAAAVSSDQALDAESYAVVDALTALKKGDKNDLADGNTSETTVGGGTAMTAQLAIAANMTREAQATGVADDRETSTVMDDMGMGMMDGPAMPDCDGPPPPPEE